MATSNETARQPWEEFDADLEANLAPVPEGFKATVDAALGLQAISIRLEKSLIKQLKLIAAHHGIGYQPMVRDLLNRFARSEMTLILQSQLEQLKAQEASQAPMEPVDEFLLREAERKRA